MSFMTVNPIAHWDGNDVTVIFDLLHKYYDDGDIVVILRSAAGVETIQTITTHYTLSGKVTNPVQTTTCRVTMVTAPATGERLSAYRKRDLVQALSLILQGGWRDESMEKQLDYIVMMIQWLQIQVDKSLKIPISDLAARTTEFPADIVRAGLSMVFDENGDADVGGVLTVPEASVANINAGAVNNYVSSSGLVQSIYGTKATGLAPFGSATSVTVGDGTVGIPITDELDGMSLVDVIAIVNTLGVASASETMDIQIRRRRAGVEVDLLSTKITIDESEYFARDGLIGISTRVLQTGDMLYVDRDTIHLGTAALGLSVGLSLRKII